MIGPPKVPAELVADQRRFDAAHGFEKADGVEHGVAMKLPDAAMKFVGAAAIWRR